MQLLALPAPRRRSGVRAAFAIQAFERRRQPHGVPVQQEIDRTSILQNVRDTEFRLRLHAGWFRDRGDQSQYAARRGPQVSECETCRRQVDVGVWWLVWNPPISGLWPGASGRVVAERAEDDPDSGR